jgi:RluA family pseudouridine synthase
MPAPVRAATIEILYEDDVLIAVNKPPGLVVHSGGAQRPDLQSRVREHLGREVVLFHRLDKDTSGVVLLGKQRSINSAMAHAFETKRIRKAYWAVVGGRWRPEWNRIETRILRGADDRWRNVVAGGREAISTCRLLVGDDTKSWIEVLPKTGRTHQVRLHCLAMGHPVLGDRVYGERAALPMALHAWRVDLRHPVTGAALRIRAAPPPFWETDWLAGLPLDASLRGLLAAAASG